MPISLVLQPWMGSAAMATSTVAASSLLLRLYKKISVELYEMRACNQMRSLRSSQISTHLGRSPVLPNTAREQLGQSSTIPPALSSRQSSQGPSINFAQEQQDRLTLKIELKKRSFYFTH